MSYPASGRTSQQNNNNNRARTGAPTYNRTSAKPTQDRRSSSQTRAANLPAARQPSKLSEIRRNLVPMLIVKQDKVTTVKAKTAKPFPISAVVMLTICTLLLMFMVLSYVQINEYTIEVASLRGELSDLAGQKKDLNLSVEQKNDMMEIEKYAKENLGMVKADQLTKKHISLDQQDKVEVIEPEPTEDMTVVAGVMSAIGENFKGLWEYID